MGNLDKRIENLERRAGDQRRPVEIRVVQDGPPGREREAQYLYSIISEPTEGGAWTSTKAYRLRPGQGDRWGA
jgi:hypothetical protein